MIHTARPRSARQIRAVIFDWAGTTVDFGCHAPVAVLREVFAAAGVALGNQAARQHMGLAKKDHIQAILQLPDVAEAWKRAHGELPDESAVEQLYQRFLPLQSQRIVEFSEVIGGVPALLAWLRGRGVGIGSTTGYTRALLDQILPKAAAEGYAPDVSLTPEEAGGGRPAPWMIFAAMQRLDVYPPSACIKVGDTPADIEEGRNAGTWTAGVVDSGNETGLSLAEWQSLTAAAKETRRERARAALLNAGAHFLIDDISELKEVINHLEGGADD